MKQFFLLVLLSTYSMLEQPLPVLLINIFFVLPKHITFTSKVKNPTAVDCYLLSSTSQHSWQNLNSSKLSYLIFSCSSRKKALCNHTLSTCLVPLTFEAVVPCKQSLSGTRDSKIIQPSRSLRKKLGKGKLLRVEMWIRENPGRAPWLLVCQGSQHSMQSPWGGTGTGEGQPQHTTPLATAAARALWRKRHTEGNTRKREQVAWRKDHVQGCKHKPRGNEALPDTEQYSNFFFLSLLSEELLQTIL